MARIDEAMSSKGAAGLEILLAACLNLEEGLPWPAALGSRHARFRPRATPLVLGSVPTLKWERG